MNIPFGAIRPHPDTKMGRGLIPDRLVTCLRGEAFDFCFGQVDFHDLALVFAPVPVTMAAVIFSTA